MQFKRFIVNPLRETVKQSVAVVTNLSKLHNKVNGCVQSGNMSHDLLCSFHSPIFPLSKGISMDPYAALQCVYSL